MAVDKKQKVRKAVPESITPIELDFGKGKYADGHQVLANLIMDHGHTIDKNQFVEAGQAEFALMSTFHIMEVCGMIGYHRGEAMAEYTRVKHAESTVAVGARILKVAVAFNEKYPYNTDWEDLFSPETPTPPEKELFKATDWEDLIIFFTDWWLIENSR